MYKTILPESFDFGQPSVQIVGVGSRGLDKHAMLKRASAFDDIIGDIKPEKGYTYLHVITTGAGQQYGPNRNGDYWVGKQHDYKVPFPKEASCAVIHLDGGLQKYHDTTYTKNAKVYQQHKTERDGAQASGFVKAARYNDQMKRGQLLIAVDNQKWRDRLHKKASGQDIFLSVGCDVPYDQCSYCGNKAKSLKEYCGHVKNARLQTDDQGNQVYMLNDKLSFYDISGVDVPADKMAFVIRKVASGAPVQDAIQQVRFSFAQRKPLMFGKLASVFNKLSNIQKQLPCMIADDQGSLFGDNPEAKKIFILKVKNYPTDQVISGCNRKGILLTPDMLFSILGKDTECPQLFQQLGQSCCSRCGSIMRRMQKDDTFPAKMLDGMFDQQFLPDLNLQNLLQGFVPEFGVTRPAVNRKSITINISGEPDKVDMVAEKIKGTIQELMDKHQQQQNSDTKQEQTKEQQDLQKKASQLSLQADRTYARYLLSFAAANSDDTCQFAMRKLACYNKAYSRV